MNKNIYCKIYLDFKATEFNEGIFYRENEFFVLEYKTKNLKDSDTIIQNKIVYTESSEGCLMYEPDRKFTYYEIESVERSHYSEYIIIIIKARKRLNGIFSNDINGEIVKVFEITVSGLSDYFQNNCIKSQHDDNLITIKLNNTPLIIDTERLIIKITHWNPYKTSNDKAEINEKTDIQIAYKKSVALQEAIEDAEIFKYLLSFSSNRVYDIRFVKVCGINNEYNIEEATERCEKDLSIFAFNYRNFKDSSYFLQAIKKVFDNKIFYQRVFNQFYKTANVVSNKELNLEVFAQWVSTLEYVYNNLFSKIKNSDFDKTLKAVNKVIQDSDELTPEQKTSLIMQIKGFVDNPLKDKIRKLFIEANKKYFVIDDVLLDKKSDFLTKIIHTRNYSTHNAKKQIFNSIEIDKMNCLFKVIVFIIIVSNLNGTLTDYYYEKVKYFFDLINFKTKKEIKS